MDQIFDRLNTLFKSIFNDDDIVSDRRTSNGFDDDLDSAMDELDAFLNEGRGRDGQGDRQQDSRSQSSRRSSTQHDRTTRPPAKLSAAYSLLGVPYGTGLEECKKAWKNLLKEHHPDKHAGDPEAFRKATERCGRINDAFRIIETWHEHGHLADE